MCNLLGAKPTSKITAIAHLKSNQTLQCKVSYGNGWALALGIHASPMGPLGKPEAELKPNKCPMNPYRSLVRALPNS